MAVAHSQRITACEAQVFAGLPPAEAGHDDARIERRVESDAKARLAVARAHHDPVALRQSARSRQRRVQARMRLGLSPAKRSQASMLALAVVAALGTTQRERKILQLLRVERHGTKRRLSVRHCGIAVGSKLRRVELDA